MKNLLAIATLAAAMTLCATASAETHIEEVWDCSLREGKTIAQVSSRNANWIKYVNKNVKGGGINSRIVTPLVGDMGSFIFVDSFPNLGSWAETKELMSSGEGQKIEAAFDEVTNCSSNRLYTSTQ
jgi:hypothetical protein